MIHTIWRIILKRRGNTEEFMIEPAKPSMKGITLMQHISHQQLLMRASGEFSAVLAQIALAGKVISQALSKQGLFDRVGPFTPPTSPSEEARRIDDFARETFVKVFTASPWPTTLMLSEELSQSHPEREDAGKYLVFVDALDGAKNLIANGIVGSIFGVYRRSGTSDARMQLPRGSEQVAAGYIMYGPSTLLVYSVGNGVNMYTLDTGIGEFMVTEQQIQIPERGLTYSTNEAKYLEWQPYVRRYVDHLRQRDPKSEKYYASRYSGALLPDFHRTLLEGGVFISPWWDRSKPEAPAARRLLIYECNPLAFIAEQAGGRATDGEERILRVQPTALGQRSQFVIGSPYEVALFEDFAQGKR